MCRVSIEGETTFAHQKNVTFFSTYQASKFLGYLHLVRSESILIQIG